MTDEDDSWADFDSACFEGGFIEDVNFSEGSACGDEVGFFGVMLDAIDFSVVLNLVQYYDHIFHVAVVLFYGFVGFDGF